MFSEFGNIIKLPKGGLITPTEIGSLFLTRPDSVRDAC